MDFLASAVYGGSRSNQDIQIASRDDDYEEIEAVLTPPRHRATSRSDSHDDEEYNIGVNGVEEEEESNEEEEEPPTSPHIDNTWINTSKEDYHRQPSAAESMVASPSNSIMNDLSDLERSMNDDVSSVKDWLRKVKSERDKLRKEKSNLVFQLTNERHKNEEEVDRLNVLMEREQGICKEQNEMLVDELKKYKEEVKTLSATNSTTIESEVSTLKSQLDTTKVKIATLEEALVREKSTLTLRQAVAVEEAHKEHFEKLTVTLAEQESKFELDIQEMSKQKEESLDEERLAHSQTRDELNRVRVEKERVDNELVEMEQELGKVVLEHEKCGMLMQESSASAKEELASITAEVDKLRQEHITLKEELQTALSDKETAAWQASTTTARLSDVQHQLKNAQSIHSQESHRILEQMKSMSELVEVTSDDRDKAQRELQVVKGEVVLLTKANEDAQAELTQLKSETIKRKEEIKTLNEARKMFDTYEKESKLEIVRLQKKLESTTGDILRSVQSSDSGDSLVNSDSGGKDVETKEAGMIKKKKMPTLPTLVDEASFAPTEISIVEESTPEMNLIRDQLSAVTKERDAFKAEIDISKHECNSLRRMVNTLRPSDSVGTDGEDLKLKLIKAEEAFVNIEIEKCEKIGIIASERDALVREVKTLKASMLTKNVNKDGDDDSSAVVGGDDINTLRERLDTQVKVNERLSKELTMLKDAVAKSPSEDIPQAVKEVDQEGVVTQLQDQLDAKIKENEKLSSELMALRQTSTKDEMKTAIEVAKDIEDMKQEHRVEIKLLKNEHAELKTKTKLLVKEKDNLVDAYEVERQSNNDLESSLEEMVDLLQAERDEHKKKADEFKIIKKKLKKVEEDTGVQTSYTDLEDEEDESGDDTELASLRKVNKSLKNKSKHLTKELVDSTKAFEETITSYESVIAKVKHAMAEKKEENEKLRHELDEAKTALAKMEEDSKDTEAHEEEINNYREAVDVLKKKLEEGASTIRIHEQDKTKLRLEVGRLNSDFTEVISQFERELSLSCEASEVALREKHKECEAVQVALDKSKAELMRMRSELANAEGQDNESSQTMLNLRCELSEKETKLENTLLNLDTSIECNSKHEKTIRKLREELNELESEKEEAETLLGQLEVSKAEEAQTYQGVVEQLEGKIQEVMSSLEENREFYQDLRSECAKLKEEKEALEAENVELSANISSLAKAQADLSVDCAKQKEEIAKVAALKEENETLKAQIERQHESVDFIENQLENIREEVKTTEEARQKSIKETGVAKEELLKAMLKLDDLTNTNQQQRGQIDNLQDEVMTIKGAQEELKRVTAELDNAQKLTAENEDSMLELKNNIQSLQSQVKSIESAKEESRQMYERDISLQQAEVETLRVKHNDTQTKLDSLSKLVTNLKAALESEKENAQILLSQFKKSEADRKSHVKQKGELEAELARMLMADQTKTEQIRNLEGVERKLQKSEVELTDLRVKKEELNELRLQMLETENLHNDTITELKSKIEADKKQFISMEEKISSLESHILSLQQEFKRTLHKKEEEASQLRVTLQESTDKIDQLWNENRDLKQGNDESLQSLQHMLNDAIRSRANTDATLQESLQLLEQQKRIDIKRKGEIAKLEQTVEILKSKERYLESYVQSLKKQIRRS